MPKTKIPAVIATFILCMIFWVAITWNFSFQELLAGVVVSLAAALFSARFMIHGKAFWLLNPAKLFGLIYYVLIVFPVVLIKANVDMAKRCFGASVFTDGVAAVKVNDSWSLINEQGKDVSKTKFTDIKLFDSGEFLYDGLMLAAVKGEYGIYDQEGKKEATIKGKDVDLYLGEYIAFKDSSGKWGFVNEKGNVVIKPSFSEAKSFSCGVAAVKKNDKWGFINKDGELVVDYQFVDVNYFNEKGINLVSLVKGEYFPIEFRFNEGR